MEEISNRVSWERAHTFVVFYQDFSIAKRDREGFQIDLFFLHDHLFGLQTQMGNGDSEDLGGDERTFVTEEKPMTQSFHVLFRIPGCISQT